MSDVQLPPERGIVLAWWDGVAYFAQLRRGKWIRLDVDGVERVEIAPELWVPLSHAKAATRLVEALEQLAQWDWRTCEERDPANGPCHCSDCRTVAIARAALENRP